jgi:acetylornithine deacetylase
MLQRLVAFDTTSRNSNLELIQYIQGYLDEFGVASTLVPNAEGTKANLFASIGPDARAASCCRATPTSCRSTANAWTTDPLDADREARRQSLRPRHLRHEGLHRRALSHVPAFQRARSRCRCTSPSATTRRSAAWAPLAGREADGAVPRPQAVIVGEPTMMGVVIRAERRRRHRRHLHRRRGASSMTHLGVSAIHFAGDFIHWLNELQDELSQRRRTDIDTIPGHTTINVGIVTGGTAGNILARECTLNWGYRTLPGDDPWEVQRRAETTSPSCCCPR